MKVFCKNCNSEKWTATGNMVYCVKCGQPIDKFREIPIYTKSQVEQIKTEARNTAYDEGFEKGFELGFVTGYDIATEENDNTYDFYKNRFTKIT